ncbi:ATP-binding cassette domain-containing protein [Gemella bergeri]
MLTINNLTMVKNSFKLGPVNLDIKNGYVYAIVGNSGAGKTVFLQSILGGFDIRKDMVYYDKLNFNDNELEIKFQYSYIADKPLFSDKLRVDQLISKLKKLDERLNIEKCFKLLKKYKVYRQKKIYELSQGQIKILLFSIGISTKSNILVLDNPFSGVGLIAKRELLALLREYITDDKIIIIVTEEMNVIQHFADYIIVFENGKVILNEDIVSLQEKFNNTNVEEILITILQGGKGNEQRI